MNKTLLFLYKLLTKPVSILKNGNLIDYDKKIMNRIYYFSYIGLGSIYIIMDLQTYNDIYYLLFSILLLPLIALLNKLLIPCEYYIVLKKVLKKPIVFEQLKIIMYPLIVIDIIMWMLLKLIFIKFNMAISIIEVVISIWFKVIMFLIMIYYMKYSYKESIKVILLLVGFEMILGVGNAHLSGNKIIRIS